MPDRDLQPTECLMTIAGTGSYVPERVLTNADLEKMVDTTDEWITTRTGIKERRIAAAGENTSDMATAAARRAMEMAGVNADEIELIIVATVTPDTIFPSTACYVQKNLGAVNAVAFDISAACSGFLYAHADQPALHQHRQPQDRAHHRGGKTLEHRQLVRPQHLRPLR